MKVYLIRVDDGVSYEGDLAIHAIYLDRSDADAECERLSAVADRVTRLSYVVGPLPGRFSDGYRALPLDEQSVRGHTYRVEEWEVIDTVQ